MMINSSELFQYFVLLRSYFSDNVFSSFDDIIDDHECNHESVNYLAEKNNIDDPTDGLEDAHVDDTLDDPADDPVDGTDDDSKQKGAFILILLKNLTTKKPHVCSDILARY